MPECAYINRILNMPRVLKMSKFCICQSSEYGSGTQYTGVTQRSEYARVTQGPKYATKWLNRLECEYA